MPLTRALRALRPRDEDTSAYISPLLTRIPNELLETFHYLVARLAAEDKLPQRIGVVAANHGEGTTTVARLLAAVLVNDLNRSVCLIDVDPRHNMANPESGEPQAGSVPGPCTRPAGRRGHRPVERSPPARAARRRRSLDRRP